jgi:hypothetical protein
VILKPYSRTLRGPFKSRREQCIQSPVARLTVPWCRRGEQCIKGKANAPPAALCEPRLLLSQRYKLLENFLEVLKRRGRSRGVSWGSCRNKRPDCMILVRPNSRAKYMSRCSCPFIEPSVCVDSRMRVNIWPHVIVLNRDSSCKNMLGIIVNEQHGDRNSPQSMRRQSQDGYSPLDSRAPCESFESI